MNRKEREEYIARILSSELFSTKQVLKKLLKYLFEKTENEENIQEIDIAIDVFHRENNFDATEDTIVRVNIHKLRKALERYSLDEGKKEKYLTELPKASYSLRFVHRNARQNPTRKFRPHLPALILILVLASSNFYLINKHYRRDKCQNLVWKSYLKQDLPVCITLADPFFFRAKNKNENYIVRDIRVNTTADLDTLQMSSFKSGSFEMSPLEYSYFSQNNLWPLPDIIPIFVKFQKDFKLIPLSSLAADDMKSYNHIIIGNINSLGDFTKYLDKTSIRVKTNPRRIIIHPESTDSLTFYINEKVEGHYVDHAFLVKIPGPENTTISLLGDFHASGNKGLSHLISEKNMLKNLQTEIKNELGYFPEFFEMVVEVSSYNYEDFETKLVLFNEIKK